MNAEERAEELYPESDITYGYGAVREAYIAGAAEAEKKLEQVREILANEPDECPEHPDDDLILCGWRNDIFRIRRILNGNVEEELE